MMYENNKITFFVVMQLLKELKSSPKKKVDVVAVVGAGHLEGMQRIWNARQTPPLPTELETQKLFQQILAYPGMEGVNYTKKDLR